MRRQDQTDGDLVSDVFSPHTHLRPIFHDTIFPCMARMRIY